MSVGSRIRKAREARKLSPAGAAKLMGVSRPTVENWEKDTHRPTKKQIPKIIAALGMRLSDFNEYSGGVISVDAARKAILVPLIDWSDLRLIQAGTLQMAAARKPRLVEASLPDMVALQVNDLSMEPAFRLGERIFIQPGAAPQDGDAVVARMQDGEHVLRCYKQRRNGAFDLVAENPEFPTLTINASLRAEIIGVVVEHHRRLTR